MVCSHKRIIIYVLSCRCVLSSEEHLPFLIYTDNLSLLYTVMLNGCSIIYQSIIVHLGFSFLLQKPLWLILRKLSANKLLEYNCWVKENEKFKLDPGCLLKILFNLNPLQLNLPQLHKNNILKCALFKICELCQV